MDTLATVVVILGLVFLFKGEPDVWDKWHAEAMGKCQIVKEPK